MEIRYEKHWSSHLNRDMEFKIYGHSGRPVLFIPCQAGRFWDFEAFHMDETWAPWIESGQVMVFACDTIDNEAWAAVGADNRWRIENHEKWFRYICYELVPAIHHIAGSANGFHQDIMTFGASMGAMHATCTTAARICSTAALPFPACMTIRSSLGTTVTIWCTTTARCFIWRICPRIISTWICTAIRRA